MYPHVAALLLLLVEVVVVIVTDTIEEEVVVTGTVSVMITATLGAVMSFEKMTALGAVMIAEMMIAVVIGVMSIVTDAMKVVDTALTVYPPSSLILNAKSARNMDILQMNVGGVILMTIRRGMMQKREHILPPMVLIQIGILILVPHITLPVS
jgi:hypothetical protein